MEVTYHLVAGTKQLVPTSYENVVDHQEDVDGCYLIDVFNPERRRLASLLQPFNLHPLVGQQCMDPKTTATVSRYLGAILVQFPKLRSWDDAERSLVSVICLARTIIIVRRTRVAAVEELLQNVAEALGSLEVSTDALVYLLIDQLVDQTTEFALNALRDIEHLEESIGPGSEAGEIGRKILELKRAVLRFEMTVEEQHRCVAALASLDAEPLGTRGYREYFLDIVSHLEHDLRSVERSEARLSELDRHNILMIQDRTGKRLKILTILSAVFMPLTLIAGIYGMNFHHMPELSWRYGYGLVLALMLALAIGLLWFLYKKGWFE